MLKKQDWMKWQVLGCCEHGNEPSRFRKYGEFLEQQRNYRLLKKDSAPAVLNKLRIAFYYAQDDNL